MAQYIKKSDTVAEIEKLKGKVSDDSSYCNGWQHALRMLEIELNTLEVKDPYKQCIQYDSIKAGIQAHAETYSFNIESHLFPQLTKEQQALWRKEIEQACISGGDMGYSLAKDPRYKENLEVKEVDLDKEINKYICDNFFGSQTLGFFANRTKEEPNDQDIALCAKHFFELGLKSFEAGANAMLMDIENILNTPWLLSDGSRNAGWLVALPDMIKDKIKELKGE